jgi:hypothetical protein
MKTTTTNGYVLTNKTRYKRYLFLFHPVVHQRKRYHQYTMKLSLCCWLVASAFAFSPQRPPSIAPDITRRASSSFGLLHATVEKSSATSSSVGTKQVVVSPSKTGKPSDKYCIPLEDLALDDLPRVGGYVQNFFWLPQPMFA